jgi:hypothetical protein
VTAVATNEAIHVANRCSDKSPRVSAERHSRMTDAIALPLDLPSVYRATSQRDEFFLRTLKFESERMVLARRRRTGDCDLLDGIPGPVQPTGPRRRTPQGPAQRVAPSALPGSFCWIAVSRLLLNWMPNPLVRKPAKQPCHLLTGFTLGVTLQRGLSVCAQIGKTVPSIRTGRRQSPAAKVQQEW